MKKRSLKLLACVAALAMVFSLGACSKSNDSDSDKETNKKTESNKDTDKETDKDTNKGSSSSSSSSSSLQKFDSIEAFVNSDEFQSQFSSMLSSMEASGMSMEIKGEDNKLIYSLKITNMTIEDAEGMAEILQQGLAGQESTFKTIASSLKLSVDVDNPVVVVEYLASGGEVIYSQEFEAN